ERKKIQDDYIQALQKEQNKLSNSLIAKYLIEDYSDLIESKKKQIQQEFEEGNFPEILSFNTRNLHYIHIANSTFEKDELLAFGGILDAHFAESAIDYMSVNLDRTKKEICINIFFCGVPLVEEDKEIFQEFVMHLNENLFIGKRIKLQLEIDDEQSVEPHIFQFSS
ncbi:MAG: hypothetical protein K2X39_00570, partial [Silvanigrellaceae bacterium]|nr:hypothetical protein [Silvanigrellaceae bacterium]